MSAFSLATLHSFTRGGPDVVLCYRLRPPTTNLHDLVHHHPGKKCAGGASHARGMHHEARQFRRPQIDGLAWRPSYGQLKKVDGPRNLSVVPKGNRCPAVRSHPIRCAAEMYAVAGRDAQIAGQSRFAIPTTTSLEARSVLRNRKLKSNP